jgi:hypothetical protein
MSPEPPEMRRDRATNPVKRYVVKLSDEERRRLNALIRTGKHRARQLMKARILLKADASEAGEGWSDSQIASALETSVNTVARTRQRLVEQGFEAALTHKHSPASARPRIFDGAAEAKLLALACSEPPKPTFSAAAPDICAVATDSEVWKRPMVIARVALALPPGRSGRWVASGFILLSTCVGDYQSTLSSAW